MAICGSAPPPPPPPPRGYAPTAIYMCDVIKTEQSFAFFCKIDRDQVEETSTCGRSGTWENPKTILTQNHKFPLLNYSLYACRSELWVNLIGGYALWSKNLPDLHTAISISGYVSNMGYIFADMPVPQKLRWRPNDRSDRHWLPWGLSKWQLSNRPVMGSSLHDGISALASVEKYHETVYPAPRAWLSTIAMQFL